MKLLVELLRRNKVDIIILLSLMIQSFNFRFFYLYRKLNNLHAYIFDQPWLFKHFGLRAERVCSELFQFLQKSIEFQSSHRWKRHLSQKIDHDVQHEVFKVPV